MNQNDKNLIYFFYYDQEINEQIEDMISCACTEVEFPLDFLLDEKIVRIDYPNVFPIKGIVVYLRKEENFYDCDNLPFPKLEKKLALNAKGRISVLKAIRGHITPNLRSIKVRSNEKENLLNIYFYYDKEISPEIEIIKKNIELNLENSCKLNFQVERLDYPIKSHYIEGDWLAYERKEV